MKRIEFTLSLGTESKLVKFCSELVSTASNFTSNILLNVDNGNDIDLKSILGIMSLCISSGKHIQITIDGNDEDNAFTTLSECTKKYMA